MVFEVINPVIIGTFKVIYNEDIAIDAASKFWKDFSELIMNEMPKTYITLRDENGKLYHFQISEKKNKSDIVDLTISQVELSDSKSADIVTKTYDTMKSQSGGNSLNVPYVIKSKIHKHQPIIYYHYIPSIYQSETIFIPTFHYPLSPYIEIGFSSAFWK